MRNWNEILKYAQFNNLPYKDEYKTLLDYCSNCFNIPIDNIEYLMERSSMFYTAPGCEIICEDTRLVFIRFGDFWYIAVRSNKPIIFFNREIIECFDPEIKDKGPFQAESSSWGPIAGNYYSNKRDFYLRTNSLEKISKVLFRLSTQRGL